MQINKEINKDTFKIKLKEMIIKIKSLIKLTKEEIMGNKFIL